MTLRLRPGPGALGTPRRAGPHGASRSARRLPAISIRVDPHQRPTHVMAPLWERISPIVDTIWAILRMAGPHKDAPDAILIMAESAGCAFAVCLPLGCLLTLWTPVNGCFRSQYLDPPHHLGPTLPVSRLILMTPYPSHNLEPAFRLGLWEQTRGLFRNTVPALPTGQGPNRLPPNRILPEVSGVPRRDPATLSILPGWGPPLATARPHPD